MRSKPHILWSAEPLPERKSRYFPHRDMVLLGVAGLLSLQAIGYFTYTADQYRQCIFPLGNSLRFTTAVGMLCDDWEFPEPDLEDEHAGLRNAISSLVASSSGVR